MADVTIKGKRISELPDKEVSGVENVVLQEGTKNFKATLNGVKAFAVKEVSEKVDDIEADVKELKMLNSSGYYVRGWVEDDLSPDAVEEHGDREFANRWKFFLLDTTDNTGETTKPVGELMRGNLLRFTDGRFAPTVGITEAMRAECDVELYLDPEHTQKYCDAGAFDPEAFYNEYGMASLYNSSGVAVRVLRPWETVETKYTIGIGRDHTVYLLDNQVGKSGKLWSGIFSKPVVWDGIDVSKYPLAPTAMGPCPVCTVGGKTRNFFYLYEGDANCKSSAGQGGLCTMFLNKRTYPRTSDMQQIRNMDFARANNADPTLPYPFAEGGFHALNTYITSQEVYYGTKYLHDPLRFGSGISSNDSCSNEELWRKNGGVRYSSSGKGDWKYAAWSAQGDICYNEEAGRGNFSVLLNSEYPKEQCMESQMAASYAKETGVSEGVEFEFYKSSYRFDNVPETDGIDGMNVRVYKKMEQTISAFTATGEPQDFDIEVMLRMSLFGGVNLSGDVFAYFGGGYEQVGTLVNDVNVSRTGNPIKLYLEPDQTKWIRETAVSKPDLGVFDFESFYPVVGETSNYGDGYAKKRNGHSSWKTEKGGSISTGQGYYASDNVYWSSRLQERARVAARFSGLASHGYCSPRSLAASYAVSAALRHNAGSAQALIEGAAPPQAE